MNERSELRRNLARIVLDNMYQFVALLDLEGTLLDVNQAALVGGGICRDAILGRPFWEAHWWTVSEDTQARLRDAIARAGRGEFVRYEAEVFGGAAGSELITIDFSLNPVRDAEGRVIYLLPEGRNITEKKLAEEELARKTNELERLNERLREFDRLKTQFFANVSHELRTPLALVLGPVERLLADERIPPAARESLGVVERNARTLLKHVNDLLDLSRLEAGRMPMRYASVGASRLVRFVASHFDLMAAERGLDFRVETPAELVMAELDLDKAQRILLNLLSNAFKFVPDLGVIVVTVERDGDRIRILVDDSGPGIPEAKAKLVFDRFQQIDGSPTRERGGTGLGLSIAHEFVALHRGTIDIERSPWGGARVIVTLPRLAPEGAQVDPTRTVDPDLARQTLADLGTTVRRRPPSVAPESGRPIALVVEDHPEMNDFIARSLAGRFHVIQAFDGTDALDRITRLRPDLVVCDVMMPCTSGDAFVVALRASPAFHDVPVIMLTAKADDELRVRMLGAGADDYVQKPFSPAELLARASRLVSERRRAAEVLEGRDARHRTIVETAHEGIVSIDGEARVRFANEALARFLGTSVASLTGASLAELVVEDDRPVFLAWVARIERAEGDGREPPLEVRFPRPDGAIVHGLATGAPDRVPGEPAGAFVMIGDITAQKQVEQRLVEAHERLSSSLRQRESLLRELHHRVKNNLQVVSSLLYLQTTHEALSPRDALLVARNRVESISLVHDVLHRGDDLASLDFGAYVEGLCHQLAEVYARDGAQRVELRIETESAAAPIDTVVPCGLVLNELVSNAFKHAFPDGVGAISVSLRAEPGSFVLAVSDDGIGMHGDSSTAGLGLRLVRRLAAQAGATLDFAACDHGTAITVTIPRGATS